MEIKTKEELIDYLNDYEITYDYDQDYRDIYNACADYMNNTQDCEIEDCFNDYIDYDLAEEYAKHELDTGGLVRLYYFMGNCNFNDNLFRLNAYNNLEEITKEDLECLKEDIIDRLKED